MRRAIFASFFLALVLVAVACVDEGGTNRLPTVDGKTACRPNIASIQATVLGRSCTGIGCHRAKDPAASLDLESPGVDGRLVNVLAAECPGEVLVKPGKPDTSFLVRKLEDAQPTCGIRMPRLENGLLAGDLACIREWIAGLPATGPISDASAPDVAPFCTLGEHVCNGACVDDRSDPRNCGECGMVCPGDKPFCSSGQCVASCPNGTTVCGGGCIDTKTSAKNCGSCGKTCAVGKVCANSACSCGAEVKYKAEIEDAILVPLCATSQCHGRAGTPAGSLDLRAGIAYGALVDRKSTAPGCSTRTYVVPGDVSASYLVDKLAAASNICGSPMPKAGGIGAAQVALIEAWICNGGKND